MLGGPISQKLIARIALIIIAAILPMSWFYVSVDSFLYTEDHVLSCLRWSLGGLDPRRITVCWSGVCEDQEQRSYIQRARVRLRMTAWERGEEWGQFKRVWGSLPTI